MAWAKLEQVICFPLEVANVEWYWRGQHCFLVANVVYSSISAYAGIYDCLSFLRLLHFWLFILRRKYLSVFVKLCSYYPIRIWYVQPDLHLSVDCKGKRWSLH